jgi:hypothetical protein
MSDIVRALAPVVDALEALRHRYRVGGSVASSALGVPRSTLDVDIVCDLSDVDVDPFVSLLSDAYYVDADMIRDAIRRRASFNGSETRCRSVNGAMSSAFFRSSAKRSIAFTWTTGPRSWGWTICWCVRFAKQGSESLGPRPSAPLAPASCAPYN